MMLWDVMIRCKKCDEISVVVEDGVYLCTSCTACWHYNPYLFKPLNDKEITCVWCERINGKHYNIGSSTFLNKEYYACSDCGGKFTLSQYKSYLASKCNNPKITKRCHRCSALIHREHFADYCIATCRSCKNKWIEVKKGRSKKRSITVKCASCTQYFRVRNYDARKPSLPFYKEDEHAHCHACFRDYLVKWIGRCYGPCPRCHSLFPIYARKFSNTFECIMCGHFWDDKNKSYFKRIADGIKNKKPLYIPSVPKKFKKIRKVVTLEDVADDMTNFIIYCE